MFIFIGGFILLSQISFQTYLTRWDSVIDSSLVTVGYEDRFTGVQERGFDEFNWVDDLGSLSHLAVAIPKHRVVYFKYRFVNGSCRSSYRSENHHFLLTTFPF